VAAQEAAAQEVAAEGTDNNSPESSPQLLLVFRGAFFRPL